MPLVGIKSISPGVNTQYHTEFWRLDIEYENPLHADSAQTKNCYTFHCLRVQAWHLNISQLFDDLGHENHIWKPGDLPEGCSVVHLDCSIHLFWTQADPSHLPVHHGTQEGEDLSQLVWLGSVAALHWSTDRLHLRSQLLIVLPQRFVILVVVGHWRSNEEASSQGILRSFPSCSSIVPPSTKSQKPCLLIFSCSQPGVVLDKRQTLLLILLKMLFGDLL